MTGVGTGKRAGVAGGVVVAVFDVVFLLFDMVFFLVGMFPSLAGPIGRLTRTVANRAIPTDDFLKTV
jgi:hypothetical protein